MSWPARGDRGGRPGASRPPAGDRSGPPCPGAARPGHRVGKKSRPGVPPGVRLWSPLAETSSTPTREKPMDVYCWKGSIVDRVSPTYLIQSTLAAKISSLAAIDPERIVVGENYEALCIYGTMASIAVMLELAGNSPEIECGVGYGGEGYFNWYDGDIRVNTGTRRPHGGLWGKVRKAFGKNKAVTQWEDTRGKALLVLYNADLGEGFFSGKAHSGCTPFDLTLYLREAFRRVN